MRTWWTVLLLIASTSGAALGCATGSGGAQPDARASAASISREARIVVGAGTASSPRFRARVRIAARGGAR